MWMPNRRKLLVSGGALAASAGLSRASRAQDVFQGDIRIGTVFPGRTGLSTVRTSINDYPGEAARQGAILAKTVFGEEARDMRGGEELDVLLANAPIPEAAERAGYRMIEVEKVHCLVGGVGEGQAEILSAIAHEARVPFFNVGSSSDALRNGACSRYTFHIEASAAMYLDALAILGARAGYRSWFIVHEDTEEGAALAARATRAIEVHGEGGTVVGAAPTEREQPVYINETNNADRAGADVFLTLLTAIDQLAFLNQAETMGVLIPALTYPDVVTQTRDYISAARFQAAVNNPRQRVALWEATLSDNGAAAFNERFTNRWSETTDPTAWASYHAIKIFWEAVKATGSLEADDIVAYLESPEAVFDVLKGPGISFRSWDHQLRQPIEVVNVDQEVEWVRLEVATRIAIAGSAGQIPAADAGGGDITAILDTIGDGPDESTCVLG